MKMESSDQLEVIKSDQNPVTAEESDEVMSEGNNVWMLTDRIHPQEVRAILDEFIGVFSDSCPKPNSPFWNISKPIPPNWDIHHTIDLVPVLFNSYFWKTLWHLLGTKLRFTATYLTLCFRIFDTI